MELRKVLITTTWAIAWIIIVPLIIFAISSLISMLLVHLNVCTGYDNNDFGKGPIICDFFTMTSLFGLIILMFTSLGFGKFIGTLTIVFYFILVFSHNRKNPDETWKYSTSMIVFACILIIMFFVSHLSKEQRKATSEQEKEVLFDKHTTPTETLFVCNGSYSLSMREFDSAIVEHVIDKETTHISGSLVGNYDDDDKTFEWRSNNQSEEQKNAIGTCKNINEQTLADIYEDVTLTVKKGLSKNPSTAEFTFVCNDNYKMVINQHNLFVSGIYTGENSEISTLGTIDDDRVTFVESPRSKLTERQISDLQNCKNSLGFTVSDLYKNVPVQ